MKPNFAVVSNYSYDPSVCISLFAEKAPAQSYLQDTFDSEVANDRDNGYAFTSSSISDDTGIIQGQIVNNPIPEDTAEYSTWTLTPNVIAGDNCQRSIRAAVVKTYSFKDDIDVILFSTEKAAALYLETESLSCLKNYLGLEVDAEISGSIGTASITVPKVSGRETTTWTLSTFITK